MRKRLASHFPTPLLALVAATAYAVGSPPAALAQTSSMEEVAAAERAAVEQAIAYIDAKEHTNAINIVESVIEATEQRSNRYDPALVKPLVVLGDALVGVGDTPGAVGTYDRALHIARVNHGLHHPSQVPVVYRQARLHAEGGDFASANSRHEYAYGILLRAYGGDNPSLLPGLFVLADWYMSNYNIFSARALYEHAVNLLDRNFARDHPAHIRALRSLARTYRNERFPPFYTRRGGGESSLGSYTGFQYRGAPSVNSFAKGERALIEVVNIVQARDDAEGEELAHAMLELGDWFLMFEKQARATSLYRHVWALLQSNPTLLAKLFAAPTPLYLPLPRDPRKPDGAKASETKSGVVELSIHIDERGFVGRINTLRSEPAQLMDFRVRRAVKRARYRPAFDGQAPQATNDVRVVHTFVYYPSAQAGASSAPNAVAQTNDNR